MTCQKTANELFEEATGIIVIENVSQDDIRRYLWQGDGSEDIDVSNDVLLLSNKFKNESLEAAQGISIERYQLYFKELTIE